ncbi:nuclear transport factor 2 family protein [Roseobacter sp. YSTF-M11]|uniref:Nuclear transport factor 2 family protein n=1 Tax=Roseobacter insulae TaxID=2859783 RepID=A0A9X1JXX3_9RHOB|nr:nuclear transport factor 2 family protein [Roseobacter insulae]MBW4707611.1 nuclear transport factor 2 family protein [Roseobacter insulae]
MTLDDKATQYTAAWNSGDPAAVAGHFAPDAQIVINRGDPHKGAQALRDMAAGFHAEFPDLHLTCDAVRGNGDHAVYLWTLRGHHSETKNAVTLSGWEEWDLNEDSTIAASKGWFDAEDYQRQIDGNT